MAHVAMFDTIYGDGVTSYAYQRALKSRYQRQESSQKKRGMAPVARNLLHEAGERLYGNGLIPNIYIRALAKDLDTSTSTVHDWWYNATSQEIPDRAKVTLALIQARRHR
ncbi:hypothetical protein ACQZV8_00850 [Magnetococcales bacterium HHB-1]